jgi:hypothetical protein
LLWSSGCRREQHQQNEVGDRDPVLASIDVGLQDEQRIRRHAQRGAWHGSGPKF